MSAQKLWQVRLLIKGVGWRASLIASPLNLIKDVKINNQAKPVSTTLLLHVGYSHPVTLPVPQEVQISCTSSAGGYQIRVISSSSVVLGNFAASIQRVRPWSPYTGHGIVKRFTVPALTHSPDKDTSRALRDYDSAGVRSMHPGAVGVRVPKPSRRKVGKRK